jgi:hypothetical protein
VPGLDGVHDAVFAVPYARTSTHPVPDEYAQNWYCSGADPPVVVTVHVTGVHAVTGDPGLGVTPVTTSGFDTVIGVLFTHASYVAPDPALFAHACTVYVPASAQLGAHVYVFDVLYACTIVQPTPFLYREN